jgi:hypothetical protein
MNKRSDLASFSRSNSPRHLRILVILSRLCCLDRKLAVLASNDAPRGELDMTRARSNSPVVGSLNEMPKKLSQMVYARVNSGWNDGSERREVTSCGCKACAYGLTPRARMGYNLLGEQRSEGRWPTSATDLFDSPLHPPVRAYQQTRHQPRRPPPHPHQRHPHSPMITLTLFIITF